MEFLDKNGLKVFIEQLKGYMNKGLSDKEQTIEQNVTTAITQDVQNKIDDRLKQVIGIDKLDDNFSDGGDLYRILPIKLGLDDLEINIKNNITDISNIKTEINKNITSISSLQEQLNELANGYVTWNDFEHTLGTNDVIDFNNGSYNVREAFEITDYKFNDIFRVLGTDDLIYAYDADLSIQTAFEITEEKLNSIKYKSFTFENETLDISVSDFQEIINNNIQWLLINGSWVYINRSANAISGLYGTFYVQTYNNIIFYNGSIIIEPPNSTHPNQYRLLNDTAYELNLNNKFQSKLTNSTKLTTINGVTINYNGNTVVGPTKSEFDELSKRVNIGVPYLMLNDFDINNTDTIDISAEENMFIPSSYNAFRNDITPGSIIINNDTHKGMLTWHGMINEENDNIEWFAEGSVYTKQNASIDYSNVVYVRMTGILTESYMTIGYQSTDNFNVNA